MINSRNTKAKWKWTPEIIQKCAQMWADGKSYLEISEEIGVTRNMVSGLASRNRGLFPKTEGAKKRGSFIEKLDIVKAGKLWEEGKSYQEIASEMGVTTNAIQLLAQRNRSIMPSRRSSSSEGPRKRAEIAKTISEKPKAHNNFHGTKQAIYINPELDAYEIARLPGVPLIDNDGCMYPLTDEGPHLFCGHSRFKGRYCEYHTEKCKGYQGLNFSYKSSYDRNIITVGFL